MTVEVEVSLGADSPDSEPAAGRGQIAAAFEQSADALRAHLVVTPHGWYDCVDLEPALKRWQDRVA